jgi:hypothetical protein
MAYSTVLDSQIAADKPLTSPLFTQFRDNDDFLKENFDPSTGHDHGGGADSGAVIGGIQGLLLDTEFVGTTTDFVTHETAQVYIPSNAVTLQYKARVRSGAGTGSLRLTSTSADGTVISNGNATYVWDSTLATLDVSGDSSWLNVNIQLKNTIDASTSAVNKAVWRLI